MIPFLTILAVSDSSADKIVAFLVAVLWEAVKAFRAKSRARDLKDIGESLAELKKPKTTRPRRNKSEELEKNG